jgi:carbonic anhydrase
MEPYLQNRFGKDVFFLTFSGAVFNTKDYELVAEIEHFLIRENVKKIYVVNDTSCRFLNSIIDQNKMTGLTCEKTIEHLYIEHYFSLFKDKSQVYQQIKLAELNIENQLTEIRKSSLGSLIEEMEIELTGLVTTKQKEVIREVKIKNDETPVYEF